MKTYFDCIPCFVKHSLEAVREITSDEVVIERTMKRILEAASKFNMNQSPPEMGQVVYRIIREETGIKDPYYEIKKRSTERALTVEHAVRYRIKKAPDPFEAAVRFAIAGNIMDYVLQSNWDEEKINDSLQKAESVPINRININILEKKIREAETILMLGDNAGETVFDRLLIENMPQNGQVIYAVKDRPIVNDALMEDAKEAGLDRVAQLVSNGADAPGTVLTEVSEEFKELFENADLVISKGQANFESLSDSSREIFFLTQVKCPVIGERYGYELGDWLVVTTDQLQGQVNEKEEVLS